MPTDSPQYATRSGWVRHQGRQENDLSSWTYLFASFYSAGLIIAKVSMRTCEWLDWFRLGVCPASTLPPTMARGVTAQTEGKHMQYFPPTLALVCLPPPIFSSKELLIDLWFVYLMTPSGIQSATWISCIPNTVWQGMSYEFSMAWRILTVRRLTPAGSI